MVEAVASIMALSFISGFPLFLFVGFGASWQGDVLEHDI
ncbi:putative membrane protein [Asticcacaulis biprosthecium C19]|uniref:Putative membrane protein n=1 Tax=Asticcacaulis biprosthecium C19 TaxID=715226 RepID=F4QJF4_9CAUL|nr:putative membrane protein [Asticcacaulis biprosthecium C19]